MDKLLVFSGDGHAGAPVEAYREYLEPAYRDLLDDLIEENQLYMAVAGDPSRPSPEALEVFDRRGAHTAGGEYGCWDLDVRLREIDADGVAGELIHSGHQNSTLPFYAIVNKPTSPEVRAAGARAYHRWLADFMAPAGGRLVGVAECGPCLDMDETVRELEFVASHGFVSVSLPGTTADDALPPLHDPHFAPYFAACEEMGLVLSIHAGFGLRQGVFFEFHSRVQEMMAGNPDFMRDPDQALEILSEAMSTAEDSPLQLDVTVRRPLWLLMAGGVFDRHPGLKLALTEVRADWVPATIAHLDARLAAGEVDMKMTPSEYYRRHIVVAPSSIHRAEVEMRHEIGIDQLLFGADYPHWEGTWPNTRDWIRTAFDGVPVDEVRQILGGNAIAAYGLDARALEAVAARIGPSPDLLGEGPADAELVGHFHQRSGYSRPADPVDVDTLADVVQEDVAALSGDALRGVPGRGVEPLRPRGGRRV
jgi:predicted TIM-barrel fold metal-dependent hydrolase